MQAKCQINPAEYLEVVLGVLWNLMLNAENSGVDATVVATVSKECSSRLLLAILKPCTSRNKLVFLCCRIMEALMLHEPNATLVARLDELNHAAKYCSSTAGQ